MRSRSQDLFKLLVEGVKEYAIFMIAPDGTVATWNVGAERIKGYAAAEIIGRHFSVFYPEEDVRAGKPQRSIERATRDGSFEEEAYRVRKDGSRFWANVVITALHDERGALAGFAKVTRDLTERRRAEDARRSLGLARDAVRARDDFLALASHELRTPLTSVQLGVQAALRRFREGEVITRTHVEKLQRLERHVARLGELVGALVDASTMAAGHLPLEPTRFDLADLADELLARWQPLAAQQGCALRAGVQRGIHGAWDRKRLADAVGAIIGNAIKYGAGAPVDVRVSAKDGVASIEIEDRGPGIAPEDQARVFERFERAVPTQNYGGFGVGLWTARRIVTAHGGDIDIRSARGEGAALTVRLPLGSAD